jgi:polysaccharide biosynthesis/export protein
MRLFIKSGWLLLCFLPFLIGCVSSKERTQELIYFKNLRDSAFQKVLYTEPTFQQGDLIFITVSTEDKKTNEAFNMPNMVAAGGQAASANTPGVGYLVDERGNINLPIIGTLKVEGMTKNVLNNILLTEIKTYTKDNKPVVNVRWLNFRVSLLGEVNRPGTYPINNEKVSVLDAISLAGDLTMYGKRDNIRVIREINGKREVGVLNLQDGSIFNSDFFYLRQNDVVYVEMNDRKIINTDQTTVRNIGIAATIISTVSLLITMVLQFSNNN